MIILENYVTSLIDELNSLPCYPGVSKVSYEDIVAYENILNKLPVDTVLELDTDAGTELYCKLDNNENWKVIDAPWHQIKDKNVFHVAKWFAGREFISRSDIKSISKDEFIKYLNKYINKDSSTDSYDPYLFVRKR